MEVPSVGHKTISLKVTKYYRFLLATGERMIPPNQLDEKQTDNDLWAIGRSGCLSIRRYQRAQSNIEEPWNVFQFPKLVFQAHLPRRFVGNTETGLGRV